MRLCTCCRTSPWRGPETQLVKMQPQWQWRVRHSSDTSTMGWLARTAASVERSCLDPTRQAMWAVSGRMVKLKLHEAFAVQTEIESQVEDTELKGLIYTAWCWFYLIVNCVLALTFWCKVLCVLLFCQHECLCTIGIPREGQKGALNFLELKFQALWAAMLLLGN